MVKARTVAADPWAERLRGANAAIRHADASIQTFVADNYDALAAELAEDAEADKTRLDVALAAVPDALRAREATSQRFAALIQTIGRARPGAIPWSRAERAAVECAKALDAGGEVAPIPTRDPREPLHGPLEAEDAA